MTLDTANALLNWADVIASTAIVILLAVRWKRNALTEPLLKKMLLSCVAFFGAYALAQAVGRYYFLKIDPFGQLLLPPYQSWGWFAQTALQQYIAPFAFALISGALLFKATAPVNRYFGGELFLKQDAYILFIAALLTGWPGFVLYLCFAVALTALYSLASSIRYRSLAVRIMLTFPLILAIPLVLLLQDMIAPYVYLWKLTI